METDPGRPPEVSDKEILQMFKESGDPVLTASEIAEDLDIGRRGLLSRLEQLETQGFLKSKKAGGRSTVWWYPGYTATKPVEPDQ